MNRILQADVILTLTREQAETVLTMLNEHRSYEHGDDVIADMVAAVRCVVGQCAKQGVRL